MPVPDDRKPRQDAQDAPPFAFRPAVAPRTGQPKIAQQAASATQPGATIANPAMNRTPPPSSPAGDPRRAFAGRGGVGGALYAGTSTGTKTHLLEVDEEVGSGTASVPEGESAVAVLVRDLGVFLLAPARRAQVVADLTAAGIGCDEIRELAEFIAGSEPDPTKRCRYLGSVLADPTVAKGALADIAAYRRAEAARSRTATSPTTEKAGSIEPGRAIRERDMERVRKFEAEYRAAKARGECDPKNRNPHRWETQRL